MRFLMTALAALFISSPVLAQAVGTVQVPCGPYDVFRNALENTYNEAPAARGLMAEGRVVLELWVSEGGTFTILAVDTEGNACALSDGVAWDTVEKPGI